MKSFVNLCCFEHIKCEVYGDEIEYCSTTPLLLATSGVPTVPNVIPKTLPPALAAFLASLPPADGPLPDADYVLSICLQSTLPIVEPGKLVNQPQVGPASSNVSGSSKSHLFKPRDRQHGKKRDADRQDDDDTSTVQSQPLPKDAFKKADEKSQSCCWKCTNGSCVVW